MQPNFLEHKTSSLLVMDLPSTFNLMEPAPSVLIASSKHSSFFGGDSGPPIQEDVQPHIQQRQPHAQGSFLIHCDQPDFGGVRNCHKLCLAHLEQGTEIPLLLYVRSEGRIRAASPASLGNSHSSQILPIQGRNLATSAATCQAPPFHTSGSKHRQGAPEVRTTTGTHITLPSRKLQQTLLTTTQR